VGAPTSNYKIKVGNLAQRDIVTINFEDNPSQLLKELGLASKGFEKTKSNIFTRLAGRPDLAMIVLEFRKGKGGGMYYGEIQRRDTESYRQTQEQWGQISGESTGRDQDRSQKSEVSGDDGVLPGEVSQPRWGLEQFLRGSITK